MNYDARDLHTVFTSRTRQDGLNDIRNTLERWVDENISIGAFVFTFLAVVAVSYGTGRHPGHELIFFVKRLTLHAKDMAYRFSTGLVKPSLLVHGENEPAGSSGAVGTILAKTGLSSLATRMAQRKPIGLGNFDFSCYQNSVIQGLASLVSFPGFLSEIIDKETTSEAPTSDVLQTTLQTLNSLQDRRMIMLPKVLKSMSSIEQQDAQEYFSKLLDQLDKEYLRKVQAEKKSDDQSKRQTSSNPLEGLIAQRVGCLQCGHSDGLSLIPFNDLTVPLSPYGACHLSECLDEYTKLESIEGVECPKCTLLQSEAKLLKMKSKTLPDIVGAQVDRKLAAIRSTLEAGDYSDKALSSRCELPKKLWVSTTKSKQVAIGRPPKCLVVHTNRSVFDETTGDLYKNHANVRFPLELDLGPWCVNGSDNTESKAVDGDASSHQKLPSAIADPRYSMLPPKSNYPSQRLKPSDWQYELRAAVIHHGRHENGHYICYRKYPGANHEAHLSDEDPQSPFAGWWELSDDDVQRSDEMEVLQQGQVFMLFYELVAVSLGQDEAVLRIACRTPLPVEIDPEADTSDGVVAAVSVDVDVLDESTSVSSEDATSHQSTNHESIPTALPRMATGMNTIDDSSQEIQSAGRQVNVV